MSFRPRDAVYHDVRKRIVLNHLKPGEALTELGLARLLGCSQGPVREALLKLQQDGLVIRAANRSTTVTTLEPEAAAEIVELRKRIERRGAQKAVAAADAPALARLESLLAEMREAAADGDEYRLIERDTAFHMALFALAKLEALEPILLRCIIHSHRQKLWAPGHRRPLAETAERHQPILAALAAGDGDRLTALIAHHIDTIVDSEVVAHHPQKWPPVLREG